MRTIFFLLLFGLLSGKGSVAVADGASPGWNYMTNTKLEWLPYGRPAFKRALDLNKPVFVLVYSDRCSWCEKYEKEVLETERIRMQLKRDFVPVAVDLETQRPLAKQLKAKLVPTTLVLAPDGTKLVRFYGVSSASEISETLDQVLSAWKQGKLPMVDDFGSEERCCPIEPEEE